MRASFVDLASQPVRNLSVAPLTHNATGWSENSGQPSGWQTAEGGFFRSTKAGAAGTLNIRAQFLSGAGVALVPAVPGRRYSAVCWMRTSGSSSMTLGPVFTDAAGTQVAGATWTYNDTVPSTTWVLRNATAIAPPGAVWLQVWGRFPGVAIDGTADMKVLHIVENALPPPFPLSGDTPGWRWRGAAGASESVGYPYTLEAIAGRPVWLAENVPAALTVYPLNITGPYTVATVQKLTAPASADGMWETQPNRNRRLLGSPTAMQPGANNGAGVPSTSMAVDTSTWHTYIVRTNDTNVDPVTDGVVRTPANLSPILPAATNGIRIGSRDSAVFPSVATAVAAVWPAYLNDETSKRVTAWLARRYGTPIPAGY